MHTQRACLLLALALICGQGAAETTEPPGGTGILGKAMMAMFGNVASIEWKVEGGKGEQSTVTCKKSSTKKCVVLVGMADAASTNSYVIAAGQSAVVKNPGREMSYCIAANDNQSWPSCLGDKPNRLRDSSSGASVASNASNAKAGAGDASAPR